VIEVSGVTDHVDAVAQAYWTDQPLRLMGAIPLLKISTKSFLYGAFALPPPPNTCEITRLGVAVGAGVAIGEAVGVGIGVAVGEGDGEGIGVAVGVGLGDGVGGETRIKTEPSSLVPGLKGCCDDAECRERVPVMSGVRVRD
jgi:hypothetical protein